MKTLILTPIIILLAIGCKKIDKKVEIIPNPKIEEKTPKAKALSYAIETKELLGKNLQEKMKQGGAENALEFCNVNAIPLTESVAKNHKINIKSLFFFRDEEHAPQEDEGFFISILSLALFF